MHRIVKAFLARLRDEPVLLLLFMPFVAFGQPAPPVVTQVIVKSIGEDIVVSATAPTENADGSPITDLAAVVFYWSDFREGCVRPTPSGERDWIGEFVTDDISPEDGAVSWVVPAMQLGIGEFCTAAYAVNTAGTPSEDSNFVVIEVPTERTDPAPAGDLFIDEGAAVRDLIKGEGFLRTQIVGDVISNTPCLDDYASVLIAPGDRRVLHAIPEGAFEPRDQTAAPPAVVFGECHE